MDVITSDKVIDNAILAQKGEKDPEIVPLIEEEEVEKLGIQGHYSSYAYFDLEDAVSEAQDIAPGYSMVVHMKTGPASHPHARYRIWFANAGTKLEEVLEDE